MNAWMIVPKGSGNLAERLAVKGRNIGIAVTLFVDPQVARTSLAKMKEVDRERAEVVQVEITIR